MILGQQVQLKMHVRAIFGNGLCRVGGVAHGGDDFAGFDRQAGF